jgi:hypothetical protein
MIVFTEDDKTYLRSGINALLFNFKAPYRKLTEEQIKENIIKSYTKVLPSDWHNLAYEVTLELLQNK